MNTQISAIILAAGTSSRMGEVNKLLLPLNGKSMIVQTVENILAAKPYEIIVVLGHEAEQVQEQLAHLPLHFTMNPDYVEGMTSSIQAGVRATSETDGYMICLSDLPFIQANEYQKIASDFSQNYLNNKKTIALPFYEKQAGNPVVFSSFYKQKILTHTAPEGCRSIVKANAEHILKIDMPTNHILKDVDTPDAYNQAQNIKE